MANDDAPVGAVRTTWYLLLKKKLNVKCDVIATLSSFFLWLNIINITFTCYIYCYIHILGGIKHQALATAIYLLNALLLSMIYFPDSIYIFTSKTKRVQQRHLLFI